jgi:hypothetical protein
VLSVFISGLIYPYYKATNQNEYTLILYAFFSLSCLFTPISDSKYLILRRNVLKPAVILYILKY